MGQLVPYHPTDHAEVIRYLGRPTGAHIYLVSRLTPPERGRGFVWRNGDAIAGFGFIGHGRNVLLAGHEEPFLDAMADLLAREETGWVMIVGAHGPVSRILDRYHRTTTRRPRLDRVQVYYILTRESLPDLREPRLRPATPDDLEELATAAARMSAEDFEMDLAHINRTAIRAATEVKIAERRAFVLRQDGELIFKVDLASQGEGGAQVEGVYTVEGRRGAGIASRCIAEIGHRLLATRPRLTLHVSSRNRAARRAYENAGFRRAFDLRLCIYPTAAG